MVELVGYEREEVALQLMEVLVVVEELEIMVEAFGAVELEVDTLAVAVPVVPREQMKLVEVEAPTTQVLTLRTLPDQIPDMVR
tara:strand:- start:89 stop:337 length:249 start_codon:yes stop_codon:yes gene_type:complete